jgi:hypothetical protein
MPHQSSISQAAPSDSPDSLQGWRTPDEIFREYFSEADFNLGEFRLRMRFFNALGLLDESNAVFDRVDSSVLSVLAPQVISARAAAELGPVDFYGDRWAQYISATAVHPWAVVSIRHMQFGDAAQARIREMIEADPHSCFYGGSDGLLVAKISPEALAKIAKYPAVIKITCEPRALVPTPEELVYPYYTGGDDLPPAETTAAAADAQAL